MGGGGLVILPKKSWHVWNKDNRERVRKDEEKARIEEELAKRRAEEAEQEYRVSVLRARSKQLQPLVGAAVDDEDEDGDDTGPRFAGKRAPVSHEPLEEYQPVGRSTIAAPRDQHVNFFADLEQGKKRNGENKDHEAEKKRELEKEQKRMGVLTYLGQTVTDEGTPWYRKSMAEVRSAPQPHLHKVASADPLDALKKVLGGKKKPEATRTEQPQQSWPPEPYRRDARDGRGSQQYMPQSLREERLQREREAQEQSRRLVQDAARREKRR